MMTKTIQIPDNKDFDIFLEFPNGKIMEIQGRKSNADVDYNGSLDIIMPENANITCWKGDNMQKAPASHPKTQNERFAKQLVTELPY